MEIRNFTKEDTNQVLEICREVRDYHIEILNGYFKPHNDYFEKMSFLKSLEDDDVIALVAEEKGVIAGYLLAEKKVAPYLLKSEIVYISNFGVKKDFQAQGIGKKMMDAIFEICRNDKVDEVRLRVYNKNKRAYDFYQKYGFEELEQCMYVRLNK